MSVLPSERLRGVENSFRQLLNDMHTVAEARCHVHGVGGGTAANSAAGLLPLIAVEMLAHRTKTSGQTDSNVRRVFGKIADLTGYEPYRTVGFPFFNLARNGIAHGFYPNTVVSEEGTSYTATVAYLVDPVTQRTACVCEVPDRRRCQHLVVDRSLVIANAQHLYNDIRDFVVAFLSRLESDEAFRSLVESNDAAVESYHRSCTQNHFKDYDYEALLSNTLPVDRERDGSKPWIPIDPES